MSYTFVDSASSATAYSDFSDVTSTYSYASASAAYDAWASELGVSNSATVSSIAGSSASTASANLGFLMFTGGEETYAVIVGGYGLAVYYAYWNTTSTSGTTLSSGSASLDLTAGLQTERPSFIFVARDPDQAYCQITSGKWQKTATDAIFYYEMADLYDTSAQRINVAVRLRTDYIQVVITNVNASGAKFQVFGFNQTTSATTSGYVVASSISGTIAWETVAYVPALNEVLVTEGVGVGSTPKVGYVASRADGVRFESIAEIAKRYNQTLTDLASISSSLSYAWRPGALVREGFRVLDVHAASAQFKPVTTETIRLAERIVRGMSASAADTVSVGQAVSYSRGVVVTEVLGIANVWSASAKYYFTATDRVRLADALRRFFGGDVVETIGVEAVLTPRMRLRLGLTDTAGVAESLSKKFVVRVIASDTVAIDDADVLKLVFRPQLRDGVEIAAAYVAPNGNFTTWAINTRSGAVSEYGSYEFNSFAQMGGKYLGASTSGLYELNGDDDNGTDIIATIRSGLMQMTGSRFTMLRDAYLGMRADGAFVLRIITGEGEVYNYTFTADSMTSSKVPLGKGIRARYLAFELVSTGQDFDLDSVEFVPLVSTRRAS